jgi:hypothetical protein
MKTFVYDCDLQIRETNDLTPLFPKSTERRKAMLQEIQLDLDSARELVCIKILVQITHFLRIILAGRKKSIFL